MNKITHYEFLWLMWFGDSEVYKHFLDSEYEQQWGEYLAHLNIKAFRGKLKWSGNLDEMRTDCKDE